MTSTAKCRRQILIYSRAQGFDQGFDRYVASLASLVFTNSFFQENDLATTRANSEESVPRSLLVVYPFLVFSCELS
ncbi:hypothetical protein T4B_11684 [Trichinella pseudospiralis]|uniref:Uncharacterized protein n=1 Tax=Trichinella pseudospiralis TaxID=6337 RepID=A0A0V0YN62_TRIPS|nr:hypothetical protein T4E_7419 [Trichinella pseudospiralis]KRZ33414.1 hypothetical protein T4B_11684 [Trichinella pseudospiralis]KRZ41181.1 hypothetical protein T4C_7925 [Trichinella pseudospiralis]